jgi:hypothetical protein
MALPLIPARKTNMSPGKIREIHKLYTNKKGGNLDAPIFRFDITILYNFNLTPNSLMR